MVVIANLMVNRSLHDTIGSVLHLMYHDNIDADESSSLQDMLSTRLSLQWVCENWRQKMDPSCLVIASHELSNLSAVSGNALRFRLVLSVHYYRLMLLINAPVMLKVLSEPLSTPLPGHEVGSLLEHAVPVLKHEFSILRDLHQVMCTILNFEDVFLDWNAAWWLCNYTSEYKLRLI